jgi:hypothetical protein
MDEPQTRYRHLIAAQLIKNLTKRRFEASFAPTAAQAKAEVLAMIPAGAKVFRCGSMSLTYLGLWDEIARLPGVTLIDPYVPGLKPEEGMARRIAGMSADVMLASANALTLDGRIVNLDGMGNRVAAMCFGPRKVILLVGLNKVAPDLDSAMARVKHYAGPVNALRLKLQTPCNETGLCADCKSPQRICNMWSIIEGHMIQNRIHVKLVGEDLGY